MERPSALRLLPLSFRANGMAPRSPDHALRVTPGDKVSLGDLDPARKAGYTGKDDPAVLVRLSRDLAALSELQEKLFAERRRAVLVVLQALDTAGKDGVLRHVVGPLDSRGVSVRSFRAPSEEELAHDFLWRLHPHAPARGHMSFWNRSHYEDVLVARVEKLVPRAVWEKRYQHINEFERMLVDSGTVVVKLFLHLSRQEQKRRMEERLHDPRKQWKFDPADLQARARWDDYHQAYEEALTRCSTPWAPWWIIPADHKWFRDLAVARILVETLEELGPRYPAPSADYSELVIPD
jgi:PPK2 family polyphosphate:nucleotide phosphotransferase